MVVAGDFFREFTERRERGNRAILDEESLSLRRFFALDRDVYGDGALSRKEKELQGLVASAVLRCDDCISYHLKEAKSVGATRAEVVETLAVALVVGGSIVIPHLRHAFEVVDRLWTRSPRGSAGTANDGGRA
jgi:AhpD family alkylhydroperoxidase